MGIALVAVLAFSALLSASASAAFSLGAWFANAKAIETELESETTGELSFENTSLKAGFLCSGVFMGTIGPGSFDLITSLLSLTGGLIAELDETKATGGISCVSDSKTCEAASEIWPLHFPILTELEVELTSGAFVDLIVANEKGEVPGYFLLCLALGGLVDVEELCEAVAGSGGEVLNASGGVEPFGPVTPLGTCGGTKEIGLITADAGGRITLNSGETLTAGE